MKVILAVDVGYHQSGAVAAGVVFRSWGDAQPLIEVRQVITEVEAYVPGQFYKRELPCLLQVIKKVDLELIAIVVDGFVWLGQDEKHAKKPGIGSILFHELNEQTPIIGVAKNDFAGSDAALVFRGQSQRPLFVTSEGVARDAAANWIRIMHGEFRIPTLLREVDRLSRIPPDDLD